MIPYAGIVKIEVKRVLTPGVCSLTPSSANLVRP